MMPNLFFTADDEWFQTTRSYGSEFYGIYWDGVSKKKVNPQVTLTT